MATLFVVLSPVPGMEEALKKIFVTCKTERKVQQASDWGRLPLSGGTNQEAEDEEAEGLLSAQGTLHLALLWEGRGGA